MKIKSVISPFVKKRNLLLSTEKRKGRSSEHFDIIHKSKQLILSSTNYNDYLNSYKENTQIFSFQLPNVKSYPIRKNFELLPISNSDSMSNTISPRDTLSSFNSTARSFKFKTKKMVINQKLNYNNKEKAKEENNKNNKLFIDLCNGNMSSFSLMNIEFDISKKDIKSKEKDNLQYLKDRIEKLTESQNDTYIKSQEYSINNECGSFSFNLSIESICLLLEDNTNHNTQKIYLPFDILPLFYLLEWKKFKVFISELIYIKNGTMILDYAAMESAIKKYVTFIKLYVWNNIDSSKINVIYFQNEKYFTLDYNWLVDDEGIYKFTIALPVIKLLALQDNIVFKKLLPKKILVSLFRSNFVNWDSQILPELFLHKRLRYIMKIIINGKGGRYNNKVINLDFFPPKSKKIKEYEYFITTFLNDTEHISDYHILLPHKIIVDYKGNERIYKLSIHQTKNILKMRKYWTYQEIMQKCLDKKRFTNEVVLNVDILDELSDEFISHLTPLTSRQTLLNIKRKNFIISIKEPALLHEVMTFAGEIDKIYFKIPKTIMQELNKKKVDEWKNVFYQYRNKITVTENIMEGVVDDEDTPCNRRGSTKINKCTSQDFKIKRRNFKGFTKQMTLASKAFINNKIESILNIGGTSSAKKSKQNVVKEHQSFKGKIRVIDEY